jgi:hypothetical protein
MRERRRATINDLRVAIDCMPRSTRVAMLEGLRSNEIIVGAYTGPSGICPMLAAHRAGGRTNFIAFAKAWDRFAFRGSRAQSARRATARELLILTTHLELSLLEDEGPSPDLAGAMSEHLELIARRKGHARSQPIAGRARPRPGDPDRSGELRARAGWSWLRVFRRYDDYHRAVQRLESESEALRERELVS